MVAPVAEVPMTEPVIVACTFLEGIDIEAGDDFLRVVGWIYLTTGEETHPERRIVARAVMPTRVARELVRELRKAIKSSRG